MTAEIFTPVDSSPWRPVELAGDPEPTGLSEQMFALLSPNGQGLPPDATEDEVRELGEVLDEIDAEADPGYGLAGGDYLDELDLANLSFGDVAELSNRGAARESAWQSEHAAEHAARARSPRSYGGTEGRLERAYQRVMAGTYTPQAAAGAFEWRQAHSAVSRLSGAPNCGVSDDLGYCCAGSHEAGCGSLATSEAAQALAASGAYRELAARQWVDATGLPVRRADGSAATISDVFEQAAGQRLHGQAAFETGGPRPEVAQVHRPDPYGSLADARLLERAASAMGVTRQAPAHDVGVQRVADHALRTAGQFRSGRAGHPDYVGESPGERAARVKAEHPRTMRRVDGESGYTLR